MVITDHQSLKSIWKKTIATSSPRLQRLLSQTAQYDVHIEHLRGKENVIADRLSQVSPLKPELQNYATSLTKLGKIPVHHITQMALSEKVPPSRYYMWGTMQLIK